MPMDSYLNDALLFAALSLALVLLALIVRSPPRTSMLAMLIVVAVGVVGLWLYEYHGGALHTRPALPGDQSRFYAELADAIAGDGPNPVPPEEAIRVMAILQAADDSASQGRSIVPQAPG